MIGESYLRRCEWLNSALGEMESLGRMLEGGPVFTEAVRQLATQVRAPLLFLIAGPAGAGKTTLLNALAGEALATTEREEKITRWYHFGEEPSDNMRGAQVRECARPSPELTQLQLVEMPVPGAWMELRPAILGEIFGSPDAVLFILPVPDPWNDKAWEFLKSTHALCPEKLVCVLQQSDLRSALEVETVAKHVEQRLRDQLGASSRVVCLAATKVLPAYAENDEEAHRQLEACGYGNLERQLSDVLSHNEPRLRRLSEITEQARTLLAEFEVKTVANYQALSRDAERLGELGRSLSGGKSDTVQHLTGALLGLVRACDQAQRQGSEVLEKAVTPGALLALPFTGLKMGAGQQLAPVSEDSLRAMIRPEAVRSLEDLERNFQDIWRHFHETLKTDFSTPLPPAPYDPPPVHGRAELIERIEREAFAEERSAAEPSVYRTFRRLLIGLRVFLVLILLALGGCVWMAGSEPDLAAGLGGLAGVLLGIAVGFAASQRKRLLLDHLHQLTLAREAAISAAERNLHVVVKQFYEDVNALFEPLESFCQARKEFFRPFLGQLNELAARLDKSAKALRAELGL